MKNILLPTDFSEYSEKAYKYAAAIAIASDATIHLLHDFDLDYIHPAIPVESYDMEKDEAKKNLDEAKQRIQHYATTKELKIVTHALMGDLLETVQELIKREHIDFILMGSKGATGLKSVIFGSNAARIINHTNVPCLVIPKNPIEAYNYNHIVLATDFTPLGESNLNLLRWFAETFESRITILHISPYEKDEEHPYKKELETYFSKTDIEVAFDQEVYADITIGLNEYATNNEAWLIAMGEKNKTWFKKAIEGSNVENMLLFTNFPILTLPLD
jgi:nucleotide-binding universal stress UspA family protein